VCQLLQNGDHVVSMDDVYGGTQRYFNRVATPQGLKFTFADLTIAGELEKAITDKTKVRSLSVFLMRTITFF
jgi:cystathionine gamma-lyase